MNEVKFYIRLILKRLKYSNESVRNQNIFDKHYQIENLRKRMKSKEKREMFFEKQRNEFKEREKQILRIKFNNMNQKD